ncbi:MAG: helix-turn-helix transcriptional regulator [Treponema sp.]|nr:helix-turn-helix transcriptional regulator [Treponema sp.]
MSASYKKLWKILIDRDMNKGDLIRQAKITSNIVAKMGKGEDVSMYKKSIKNVHLRWNKNVQLFG